MKFILDIQVLPGTEVLHFEIPLDLTGPATLRIEPGSEGVGSRITILAEGGDLRAWYAHRLLGLRFE